MAFQGRKIKAAVSIETGVSLAELESRDRSRRIARARQIAVYLFRTLIKPEPSLPWIARQFGQEHTTILHSLRRVESIARHDECFSALLERCRVHAVEGAESAAKLAVLKPDPLELALKKRDVARITFARRRSEIVGLRAEGASFREIAFRVGLSHARVRDLFVDASA